MIVRHGRCARLALVFTLLGLLLSLLLAAPLAAAGPAAYVLTTTLDTVNDANCAVGSCTLRQAVNVSNANSPGAGNQNAITFAAGVTGTITRVGNTPFELARDVAIAGPGARLLTVTGTVLDQNFRVDPGVMARIGGLTLSGVSAGIFNQGALTVIDSTFTGNSNGIAGRGTLTVTGSTFAGNGDGIDFGGAAGTVTNSTVTGNTSAGISLSSGAVSLAVTNGTITGNYVGIENGISGTLQVRTSIVAGNTQSDTTGPVTDQGHNLIGGAPCSARWRTTAARPTPCCRGPAPPPSMRAARRRTAAPPPTSAG